MEPWTRGWRVCGEWVSGALCGHSGLNSTNFSASGHAGIDAEGFTANFVESEQIIVCQDFVMSYQIVRGSAPVMWEQKGLKGKIRLAGGEAISKQAYFKHFSYMREQYGGLVYVTLMSAKSSGENLITKTLFKHQEELVMEQKILHSELKVFNFDIKLHCKGNKFEQINPFIYADLLKYFSEFGYFLYDPK